MGDNVPGVKPTDRDLRSAEKPPDIVIETKVLGDVSYSSVAQFPPSQIPTGSQVIGRMMSFLYRTDKVGIQPKVDEAARAIAEEISDLHIYNLNIYPMTEFNIAKKVTNDYKEFKKLLNYPAAKKGGPTFLKTAAEFNKRMLSGLDVKTDDVDREKYLAKYHGVKFGPEELKLYQDNVKVKDCACSLTGVSRCVRCPRRRHSTSVDNVWLKKDIKKRKKQAAELKAKEQEEEEKAKRFKSADPKQVDEVTGDKDVAEDHSSSQADDEFSIGGGPLPNFQFSSPLPSTRSRTSSPSPTSSTGFPKVPVRFGRRSLNPKIMATAAQISAKYEISFTTVIKAGCDWANMVFGQQWTVDPEFDEKVDDEEEDTLEVPDSEKKTRKVQQDLTFRFPSRQTLSLWLKDAAILNLKYLGEHIFNKDETKIVT